MRFLQSINQAWSAITDQPFWSIKEGYYLYKSNLGLEWLPSDSLMHEWVKRGEIG